MDAARYFEEMHLAMSSQKPEYRLVLSVKVQDLGGADAYLELRQEPVSGKARVFYSTMGRQKLNFQLVRKGVAELPQRLGRADRALPRHRRRSAGPDGFLCLCPGRRPRQRPDGAHSGRSGPYCRWLWDGRPLLPPGKGALITVERFVGRPAHWSYWSTRAAEQLNIAAILCWLGDYLAGAERRTLQSCPEAMQLAAAWQAALFAPLPQTAQRPQPVQMPRPVRRAPAVENKRWQSILAVLATV